MKDIARQIEEGTKEAGKTYAFSEAHDVTQPAQVWFQESDEGLILFVVFYTQACRWSRCLGCNLPSKCSQYHVDYRALIAQIDHLFAMPEVAARCGDIRKLIVSNNGSILDQETFSSTALMYLMAKINLTMPNLASLSVETRPEYVDLVELEFLRRALEEGDTPTTLELAIGFEAFDEHIRNDIFNKGLSLTKFENFISDVAPYGYSVKCYFMQKPVPGMTDAEAVRDVEQAIDYLGRIGAEYGVKINMHLNPTYAADGTPLAEGFRCGDYMPPRLVDVARAAWHARAKGVSVFIGLYDEGLAGPGGSFIREGDEALVANLESFNQTQDFDLLAKCIPAGSLKI
jgi:radical SAM enzyme (TIGR01210 family)